MRHRIAPLVAVTALVLAACGDDNGDDDATPREQLVDTVATQFEDTGLFDVDRDCIAEQAETLDDEQVARALIQVEGPEVDDDIAPFIDSLSDCVSEG